MQYLIYWLIILSYFIFFYLIITKINLKMKHCFTDDLFYNRNVSRIKKQDIKHLFIRIFF